MEFRLLGPLQVVDGPRTLPINGFRQRCTLAILLAHLNHVVSPDLLLEELWGEHMPATALQALRVHISQVRKVLGIGVIRTLPTGYVLEVDPDQVDVHRFERLVDEGTVAVVTGEHAAGAALLREALALWRGPALADFVYEPFAQVEIGRLNELRMAALEARIDADLALGRHAALVSELKTLAAEHAHREHFRSQLMLALYRAGRQAEALEVYRDTWRTLADELGIEPGAELRSLEQAILRQEAWLSPEQPTVDRQTAPSLVRKTVTVLHVDLGGAARSETLDPEYSSWPLARDLDRVLPTAKQYARTLLARQPDAISLVFGVPVLHEDDALRAVRSAIEARAQIDVELQPRMGIATGDVLASGGAIHSGAVSDLAVRLAHFSRPGEILLDDASRRLVSHAVTFESVDGGAAARLRTLMPNASRFARQPDSPFVGRQAQLQGLIAACERSFVRCEPSLLIINGPAGIGKSRLADELLKKLDHRATPLVGGCPSYGQDLTFWPLREMLGPTTNGQLHERLVDLLRGEGDGVTVANRILAALGLEESVWPAEETAWAFARLFRTLAHSRPHIIVLEDAHWADSGLLDLIEYLTRHIAGVPLVILCVGRPELLEARPAWTELCVQLPPLSTEETEALLENLPLGASLSHHSRWQVIALAEGNPLFVEQLVPLVSADGADAFRSNAPTIHAILSARLDRLGPGERILVERAAVVGRDFTLESIAPLLPASAVSHASRHLETLTRKMLVQPDHMAPPATRGFRFQHALIHEAAYRRLPKEHRAELHERFANWLERRAAVNVAELDEVLGYHLERACRLRLELGAAHDSVSDLATRAMLHLKAAGWRAYQRGYFTASVGLMSRALGVTTVDSKMSIDMLNTIGATLGILGQLERQGQVLDDTIRRAIRIGYRAGEWQARLDRRDMQFRRYPSQQNGGKLRQRAAQALTVFEKVGDPVGASRASVTLSDTLRELGKVSSAEEYAWKAIAFARTAGVAREQVRAQWTLMADLLAGPTPAPEAIERCREVMRTAPETLHGTVGVSGTLAVLLAMNSDFTEARQLIARIRAILDSVSHARILTNSMMWAGRVELLASEPTLAEGFYRQGLDVARETGEVIAAQALAPGLANALCAQGRVEEAASQMQATPEPGEGGSNRNRGGWLAAEVRVLALRGQLETAVRRGREAEALVAPTDLLDLRGEVALAVAEALSASGAADAARRALSDAMLLYHQKGNKSGAVRAQRALESFYT
jgi:DNA-binding SARP family transcriptional activator/tetratricopeptide (TPR) repeat protein